jgi:predicted GIY-YIG superfamily endonuclease
MTAPRIAVRLTHSVYVVELDPAVLGERRFRARNPGYVAGKPCVYVGMTGLSVAERFANHKAGHKSNRYVHQFGVRLLPALYDCFNPMPFAAAQEMEFGLAEELREKGYGVWQG